MISQSGSWPPRSVRAPAQDLVGEAEREPEGEHVEAKDVGEHRMDPRRAVTGKIGRRQRDEERVDQEEAAEEHFRQPVRVRQNLPEAVFLVSEANRTGSFHGRYGEKIADWSLSGKAKMRPLRLHLFNLWMATRYAGAYRLAIMALFLLLFYSN